MGIEEELRLLEEINLPGYPRDQSRFGPQRRPIPQMNTIDDIIKSSGIQIDPYRGEVNQSDFLREGPMPAGTGPKGSTLKDKLRAMVVPSEPYPRWLTDLAYGLGVTEDVGKIPTPTQGAEKVPDLMATEPMGPQFQPNRSGLTPSIGDMPGTQMTPQQDQYDKIAEIAPELESNERNRMILNIMEGLTRAGAEASNVPLLTELLAGKGRGPTDQRTADMLRSFITEGKTADEAKLAKAKEYDNPMVKAARAEFGKDFKNIAEVQQYMAMEKGKADIGQSKAAAELSRAKIGEVNLAQAQAEKLRQGDLSAAPEDLKKTILSERKAWKTNNKDLEDALNSAKKLSALLDANNSTASRTAITHMVKIAGDTGRLSDQDIARFEKRMGLLGVKDKLHQIVYSDLSDEQKEEFRSIAKEMSELAIQEIGDSARANVEGLAQLYPQLKEEDLVRLFLGTERYNVAAGKKEEGDFIIVIDPEGKLPDQRIPSEKLQKYLDSGWERG